MEMSWNVHCHIWLSGGTTWSINSPQTRSILVGDGSYGRQREIIHPLVFCLLVFSYRNGMMIPIENPPSQPGWNHQPDFFCMVFLWPLLGSMFDGEEVNQPNDSGETIHVYTVHIHTVYVYSYMIMCLYIYIHMYIYIYVCISSKDKKLRRILFIPS